MTIHKNMLAAGLACFAGLAVAAVEVDDMGPAAFMWPTDRVWAASVDNTAPCGSRASAGNRTDFPLKKGQVALLAQDESWDIELSISYLSDPKTNDDFSTLVEADEMREIDVGHTCITISDAPSTVKAGDPATLQIKYLADFDKPENQTFYACADIKFVEASSFTTEVPCFNATESSSDDSSSTDHSDSSSSTSDADSSDSSNSKSGDDDDDLSGGAIAGIVVGCVAAVALAGLAFFFYRRRQQRLVSQRQQQSSRGVRWDGQDHGANKGSVSSASVGMHNLSSS
ncbi:hypothetical protein GMORB2_2755 [Geosmithia morbida]|uniref:Copper acquisition factor BIM1-like domain-containing protein n=1 Tax=Geosmithia morbida TaxID=1094350 RepID=A0A9P5D1R7_9HYPO|nr:uncharacterized protein GMORB2_2755 [Geosmithia morbida]KAF4120751.1 hypothetical protein GMORB2_2755 [Geosmithia morbida]